MKAVRQRLAQLKRLEKLRAIARQNALAEAARAEVRLSQLQELGERSSALVTFYSSRCDAASGADLASQRLYLSELMNMVGRNNSDIAAARTYADAQAAQAAAAERSRAAVEERSRTTQHKIASHEAAAAIPLGARPPRPA